MLEALDSILTERQEREAARVQQQIRKMDRQEQERIQEDRSSALMEGLGADIIPGVVQASKEEARQHGFELLPDGKVLFIDSRVKMEGRSTMLTFPTGQCLLFRSSFGWLLFKKPGELKRAMADDLELLKNMDPTRKLEQEKASLEAKVAQLQTRVDALTKAQHSTEVEQPWTPLANIPDSDYTTTKMTVTECRVQMKKIFRPLKDPADFESWFQAVHHMYRESGYPKDEFVNLVRSLVEIPRNTVDEAFFRGEISTDVQLWNKLDRDYGSPFSACHLFEQAQGMRMTKEQFDGLHFHEFGHQVQEKMTKALSKVPKVTRDSRKALSEFMSVNTFLHSLPTAMAVAIRDKVTAGQLQRMEQAVEAAMNYAKVVRHTQPQRRLAVSALTEHQVDSGNRASHTYNTAKDKGQQGGGRRQTSMERSNSGSGRSANGAKGGYSNSNSKGNNKRRTYACKGCQANRSTEPCTHCYVCLQNGHRAADCTAK